MPPIAMETRNRTSATLTEAQRCAKRRPDLCPISAETTENPPVEPCGDRSRERHATVAAKPFCATRREPSPDARSSLGD